MWKCICGADNGDEYYFCCECGARRESDEPKPVTQKWVCACGAENEDEYDFCHNCGKKRMEDTSVQPDTKWVCSCGTENDGDHNFCGSCGKARYQEQVPGKDILKKVRDFVSGIFSKVNIKQLELLKQGEYLSLLPKAIVCVAAIYCIILPVWLIIEGVFDTGFFLILAPIAGAAIIGVGAVIKKNINWKLELIGTAILTLLHGFFFVMSVYDLIAIEAWEEIIVFSIAFASTFLMLILIYKRNTAFWYVPAVLFAVYAVLAKVIEFDLLPANFMIAILFALLGYALRIDGQEL